ncbi:MAG: hypothetical protein PVG03_01455 [Desulfarculaceae bacterium]|jgi:hypothetical protein
MNAENKNAVPADGPTMCSVCAWRIDCHKKYTYEQGSVIKCPDYTRDLALPPKNGDSK